MVFRTRCSGEVSTSQRFQQLKLLIFKKLIFRNVCMRLSPCCHWSAQQKSSSLNMEKALRWAWTSSYPEILIILGFDCAASVLGFFSAFSHWGFLPVLYLSGRCQFGSAAFQTNAATVSIQLSLLIQRCPHYAHTWHITDMNIQQYVGEGRGGASQQRWLNCQGLQRPHLRARLCLRLVSTVREIST